MAPLRTFGSRIYYIFRIVELGPDIKLLEIDVHCHLTDSRQKSLQDSIDMVMNGSYAIRAGTDPSMKDDEAKLAIILEQIVVLRDSDTAFKQVELDLDTWKDNIVANGIVLSNQAKAEFAEARRRFEQTIATQLPDFNHFRPGFSVDLNPFELMRGPPTDVSPSFP